MAKPLRILVVGMSHSIHTARWISQFDGLGWDIHLFPSLDRGATHAALRSGTVHHTFYAVQDNPGKRLRLTGVRLPSPRAAAWLRGIIERRLPGYRARQLARLIDRLKPDIVHSMAVHSAGGLTLEARKLRTGKFPPWLVSNWGSDLFFFGRLGAYRDTVRKVMRAAGHYSCENRRDDDLAHEFGFAGTIYPYIQAGGGWDMERLKPLREAVAPSRRKIILIKGYQNMLGRAAVALRALERCRDLLDGYEVVLFTPVPAEEVTQLVEWFSLTTGVPARALQRTGDQMRILELQAQARVFMGLSISDGVSNSFLEAMIMGAFPIQSHPSNPLEWIEQGVTGLAVEAEDSDDVERALRRALTDDGLVDSAAAKNWETAVARLGAVRLRRQAIDMYESIATPSPWEKDGLVRLADYGIDGYCYYWVNGADYDISKREMREAGASNGDAYVRLELIEPLLRALEQLRSHGFALSVRDGYRSPELYRLIHAKRTLKEGRETADRMLNMKDMPHATGLAIDVALISLRTGEEAKMQRPKDGTDSSFLGFYDHPHNRREQKYRDEQHMLVSIMEANGFSLGSRREFWHFEYRKGR